MNTSTLRLLRPTRLASIDGPCGIVDRLLDEDSGQDIVEYALLGAVIGIAAIAIWQQLAGTVGQAFGQSVAPSGQVQSLSSCTPGPDGAGC
jgi:Flp pilus assembly pilin Flp